MVCCLASLLVHRARLPALAAARLAHDEARAEAHSARQALERLERLPRGHAPPSRALPVERQIASVVASLRAAAPDGAVTIETLAASGIPAAASAPVAMASLARPLPMTGGRLRAASVSVRGRYAQLEGLMAWLEQARAQPVVLSSFNASGHRFELSLWVVGT